MTDDFCDLNLRSLPAAPTWKEDASKEAGLQRLRVLASFLEQVPEKRYVQHTWREQRDCGTTACALGWAGTVLSELTGFTFDTAKDRYLSHEIMGGDELEVFNAAEAVFGLEEGEGEKLFGSTHYVVYPRHKDPETGKWVVSPTDVAKKLHAYVDERLGERDGEAS